MSAQRVLTIVVECCNVGGIRFECTEYKALTLFLRSQEYLRLLAALDLVAFEGADDFPTYRVFRYGRRDVSMER
jgi:hypothetical protein